MLLNDYQKKNAHRQNYKDFPKVVKNANGAGVDKVWTCPKKEVRIVLNPFWCATND